MRDGPKGVRGVYVDDVGRRSVVKVGGRTYMEVNVPFCSATTGRRVLRRLAQVRSVSLRSCCCSVSGNVTSSVQQSTGRDCAACANPFFLSDEVL